MLILGIDPGYARTGWGLIHKQSQKLKLIKYGCIETSAKTKPLIRLLQLSKALAQIIKTYKPNTVAVEDLFFNTNAKTAIKVGEARGVILITLAQQKLQPHHYTPLQIKTAVSGYGRASKPQVQKMVKILLNLKTIPRPDDAADALAVAITHGFTHRL